jgi:hypothetical protein
MSKAIVVRYSPPTSTKPARYFVFDSNHMLRVSASCYDSKRQAAQHFAIQKHGSHGGDTFIEAELPKGDTVFVYDPHVGRRHLLTKANNHIVEAQERLRSSIAALKAMGVDG